MFYILLFKAPKPTLQIITNIYPEMEKNNVSLHSSRCFWQTKQAPHQFKSPRGQVRFGEAAPRACGARVNAVYFWYFCAKSAHGLSQLLTFLVGP